MSTKPWTVYIVETESGKLYTGITTDLERRFKEHRRQTGTGARFFKISAAKRVVYSETQDDRSSATRRELQIKKMRRAEKLQLVYKRAGIEDYLV